MRTDRGKGRGRAAQQHGGRSNERRSGAAGQRCGAAGGAMALRGAKTTKGEDSPFGENRLELCRWAAPPGQEAGLCRCRLFFVVF